MEKNTLTSTTMEKNILTLIQQELKVPKGNYNSFGKYKYRSAEDILEAVKPLLAKYNAILTLSDSLECIGGKVFMKATAQYSDTAMEFEIYGYAELAEHKGMSPEQATGTASSYSRKYALNGLFLIDETEADADSQEPKKEETIWLTEDQFNKTLLADKKAINAVMAKYSQSPYAMKKEYKEQLTHKLNS
jgi:hypothetical protein